MRKIGRGALVAILIAVGCSGGAEVIEEADEALIERVSHYEVVEEAVQFEAADAVIYATLTLPETSRDVPAVVLVAGSGPTDRDWNNPLLPGDNGTAIELSRSLAQAGVAVLRYDKRGTGQSEWSEPVQWEHYLSEVEGAVEFARADHRIDGERLFVAGHSEGGAHALRALEDERLEIRGLILMATAGQSLRDLLIEQVSNQLSEAGLDEEIVEAEIGSLRRALDRIGSGQSLVAQEVSEIPGVVALVDSLQDDQARPFAASILPWDPLRAVAQVERPVLIIQGVKDIQLDGEQEGRRLYDAAKEGGVAAQLVLVENADHVMKRQVRPREELGPQFALTYNDPTRRLEQGVLAAMIRWIYDDDRELK